MKGFRRFWTNKLNRILIALIVLFVSLAGVFFFVAGRRAEVSVADQMLHREQVITRAGAKSIESFLALSGASLATLASDRDVALLGEAAQVALDNFIEKWEETAVVETILVNKEGEVSFVANRQENGMKPGISVSDRDYFIAASQAAPGEVFSGEPILPRLGAYEGQYIVPMATPVYEGEEFKGVLGMAILLSELTKTYLDPLKISADSKIYLLTRDGILLHSPVPELTGVNILDYLAENPFPGSEVFLEKMEEGMVKGGEGKLDMPWPETAKGPLSRHLIAYSPLKVGGHDWVLGMATPIKDALAFFGPFYGNQLAALMMAILSILSFGAFVILAVRMARRDAYLDGFTQKRDHHERKKRG